MSLVIIVLFRKQKDDENVHRYAVRGEKRKERNMIRSEIDTQ